MARYIIAAAAAVLLMACGSKEDTKLDIEGELEAAVEAGEMTPECAELAAETLKLYEELVNRLSERDVTVRELQEAMKSGDEEELQELFGYSDDEAEAMMRRLTNLGGRARASDCMPPGATAPARPQ